MSVLKEVGEAIALRLRFQSNETYRSLKKAMRCVRHLRAHDCTVQQVTVRHDHVTIEIDQPSAWLQGAIHIKRVNGLHREVIKVTSVLSCQVQWMERELHPLLKWEG